MDDPAIIEAAADLVRLGSPLGELGAEGLAYVTVRTAMVSRARRTGDWARFRRDRDTLFTLVTALLAHMRSGTPEDQVEGRRIRRRLITLFLETTAEASP